MTRGDEFNNRDARQIRVKSVQANFFSETDPNATTPSLLRQTLFIDKQPSAAAPTASDLYTSGQVFSGLRNLDGRKRFVILKTGIIRNSEYGSPNGLVQRKFYKKLDMKTVYNASNAGTIADIESNALYMFFGTDASAQNPVVTGSARIRFIDN